MADIDNTMRALMLIDSDEWRGRLSPLEQLLLVRLARYANHKGYCWHGAKQLASAMNCDPKSVRRALKALESCGLLGVESRTASGQSNIYFPILGGVDKNGQGGVDKNGQGGVDKNGQGGWTKTGRGGGQKRPSLLYRKKKEKEERERRKYPPYPPRGGGGCLCG